MQGVLKMNEFEAMLITNKPITCECGGKFFHIGGGNYKCQHCNKILLDDFGKVRRFLEENGPAPSVIIAAATGVDTEVIGYLLKDGRVEIVEGSKYYLQCTKCGCSIRSGRFCMECARELAKDVEEILYNEIGDKPKYEVKQTGKMHFLNRKLNKDL